MISKAKKGKAHFTLIGHSMGGAIAQCYALRLAKDIPEDQIRGRTFNSALAVDKDHVGFKDWYNLCVSTDSVCNGLVPGSIIYYGIHRLGKTIWLYDEQPDIGTGHVPVVNISTDKHNLDKCLLSILYDYWLNNRCDHDWDEGVVKTFTYDQVEFERVCTCKKCGKEKYEKLTQLNNDIEVSGLNAKPYTGSQITPSPVVKQLGVTLKKGTDYKVTYSSNVKIGKAKVTITGIGKYTGSITKTFNIVLGKTSRGDMFNLANNVKVTWKAVTGAKYYKVYRSGVKEPVIVTTALVGWDKSPGLKNGQKYTYKIVASLTGKGDAGGDSALSYSKVMYRLKTVAIRSVKNTAPGKVTVTYDKTTCGDSYVLQYSDNKDMAGAITKVIKGANNNSCIIGGLKKGKTYYFSIRVRKSVNGVLYYTTFGVAKKVVITK